MDDYKVFLDFEIFRLIKPIRGIRKQQIIEFLKSLERDPFKEGELNTYRDGRKIEVKLFGKYSLLYWVDHAVKEVKIVDFYASHSQ